MSAYNNTMIPIDVLLNLEPNTSVKRPNTTALKTPEIRGRYRGITPRPFLKMNAGRISNLAYWRSVGKKKGIHSIGIIQRLYSVISTD